MNTECPLCGNKLVTEDLNLYTCVSCDTLFTLDEREEEIYQTDERDEQKSGE